MHLFLAAGAAPPFFAEVTILLVAGAVVAYLCFRLGVMPIVSFLVTGALIGPHALGLVHDEALIEAAAEVGVVLLLFTIGIEFSLDKLSRIRRLIFIGGILQVGLVVAIVAGIMLALGVGWQAAVFTGCLVALSSTAIVMKLLMSRNETNSEGGQGALGILIFQDLAVVAMVLLVPMLGGAGGTGLDIAIALGTAVALIVAVLVIARRVMPKVLEAVARTCSQEIFLLTVIAICFGTAYLTSLAGVSLSLGAFLAGLVVSESRFSQLAFGEILPLQIIFSATFFVSVGLLLDVGFILANPLLVLALIIGIFVLKAVTTGISMKVLGYGSGTVAFTSLVLAQVGEFSFVLERAGREVGLYPAGMEGDGPQAFIATTVVLMIATPYLATLGASVRTRWKSTATSNETSTEEAQPMEDMGHDSGMSGHVLIGGYGQGGRQLARALHGKGVPHVILTLSPDGAKEAEARGQTVIIGNYLRQHELEMSGINEARLLVVADDDLETTLHFAELARSLNPDLKILVRTRFVSEIHELQEAGASVVFAEEQESIVSLLVDVLSHYDDVVAEEHQQRSGIRAQVTSAPPPASSTEEHTVQLSEAQRNSAQCRHTDQTTVVVPSSDGCQECLDMGDTWVHLRICMTCGHVGCCDSSKNKHATKHAKAEGHPIVKSFEPGENWAWCYVERTIL